MTSGLGITHTLTRSPLVAVVLYIAVTGGLFFVPSVTFLENVTADEPAAAVVPGPTGVEQPSSNLPVPDGSLRIGSLKGKHEHE